jgi:tRNA dimethylallyltransferase
MRPEIVRIVDVFLEGAPKPLIVILGPTAAGKTAFSIEMAHHVEGEIVNADSRQLYTYLDIGTAKISHEETDGIPHHLIDVLDPKEEVTVGWFQDHATRVIDDVHSRNTVPILVGGSMLYCASITDALSLVPAVDRVRHQELIDAYQKDGGEKLYKRLQKIDPDAAAVIHQNNMPRVVRAIEVYEVLKSPQSKVMRERGELRPRHIGHPERRRRVTENDASSPVSVRDDIGAEYYTKSRCQYDLLIFGVERSPDELKKRIVVRTENMIEAGWIDEVRDLIARGYTHDDPGMKSHGYRQIMQYLSELESGDGDSEVMKEALKEKINAKTRQYAKKQMTWWRGDERIRWIRSV